MTSGRSAPLRLVCALALVAAATARAEEPAPPPATTAQAPAAEVTAPPAPPPKPTAPSAAVAVPARERRPLAPPRRTWLWVTLGVVVGALAITGTVAATLHSTRDPTPANGSILVHVK